MIRDKSEKNYFMTNKSNNLIPRPPIVVIMGHIDHGKSKLLDYIRKANVVEKEAGGITQHIGAYEAEVKCSISHEHQTRKITFLDTPGHEAFSKMRSRGAKIADMAILVIAADEGIKPQTMEAYEAIKKAEIPFAIVLNKMDKSNADPERIKNQLSENQIFIEGYGGKIPVANISAKTGEGVDELLDLILLMAEMENLKADPIANASGTIIESHLDQKRGISATLIIQDGKMKKGMYIVSGSTISPVRIFENFLGKPLEEATFSSPIAITGFDNPPEVGSEFKTFLSKKEAEEQVLLFKNTQVAEEKTQDTQKINGKDEIIISLIIKTDVAGSLEALDKEITKLQKEKVKINILKKETGNISENDTKFASSSPDSIILGFNTKIDESARDIAERFGIKIFSSDIIYKISEWLNEEIKKREEEAEKGKEKITGTAVILKTFSKTKTKQVVGCRALSGKIIDGRRLKIKRGEFGIGDGKITELRRHKTPVKEVSEGEEFGAMIETRIEIKKDDTLEIL